MKFNKFNKINQLSTNFKLIALFLFKSIIVIVCLYDQLNHRLRLFSSIKYPEAGKTRTIFDIAMYVVYMECRSTDHDRFIQLKSTGDRSFTGLVDSIKSAFTLHNYELTVEDANLLIRLEIAVWIFYLILLSKH
ncbi:hypothetical protein RCL_jg737.t1 [Rhizophagus clarus]|uniref:Uncharacterized protein n=1 Tax=Rhizophagus clarus TaxID=94130 RepID=A0A8H3L8M1_9GLOM|nr:hypothetical protein RCL_jg737.t1 [Rhizophagus clarus]